MVDIPKYLKECTNVIKSSEDAIILQILCDCGCLYFFLLENILGVEEENSIKAYEKRFNSWGNIENYIDPITKTRYLVTSNFFGKVFDKIPISEIRDIKRTHIIKVRCKECGKEKIIFDNRYHGYNAIVVHQQKISIKKEYRYKLMQKLPMEVEIKIRNDIAYEDYCEEVGEMVNREFANAFSSIEIYGIRDGKKKKFFEEETD